MRIHAPLSMEGRQVWDLAMRCGGQLRVAGQGGIVGFDMVAVLKVGEAMGVPAPAIAALMPQIEAAAVPAMNEDLMAARKGGNGTA